MGVRFPPGMPNMKKEKTRRRRNDFLKKKNRAKKVAQIMYYDEPLILNTINGLVPKEEWIEDFACHNANNLKKCSCSMCCNPRHSDLYKGLDRLTLRERKFLDNWKSQLDGI